MGDLYFHLLTDLTWFDIDDLLIGFSPDAIARRKECEMPRERQMLRADQLRRLRMLGYSYKEIQKITFAITGNYLALSSVGSALHRAGLTEKQDRYHDEVPWRVKPQHAAAYPVRMLRDLGRIRRGGELPEAEYERFRDWVQKVEEAQCVVAYDPDSETGFHYVPAGEGDWPDGIPIRPGIFPISEST